MSASSTTMTGCSVSPGLACAPLVRMTPPAITDPYGTPGDNPRREGAPVRDALVQLALQQCRHLAASPLYARETHTARTTAQRKSDAFLAASSERQEA
ncbi:hypothetical protein [Streptomyces sp. V1I1]|uniref:hypothetical protein n=1 Tax=Streptomyces sp. V1I1 TaxID=3042272 RepID=UPI0027896074|nr:hypothetical protein [Streptomyces sp. V1I1]MDQ0945774.1 hypothetical protein [Streptomyces sp. V1I1]